MKSYEEYVEKLLKPSKAQRIAPTIDSVDSLYDEESKLEFIKAFRELMRIQNILGSSLISALQIWDRRAGI
ncbi:Type I restriction and modification enzyme -subunit R C terminal [Wolinella succinogenes]|uniref:type I restriction endonuclease subunit R, EcoR124 family n=1 Tax=Wolinella succinogenes TaxID=844 RepID=UPI000F6B6C67|nr:hypothetical protein [Wolinella succinogenes]VEG80132.1 Type I restriction and modification enzyme -subunit R C terminal [Wolinella succinogenes]